MGETETERGLRFSSLRRAREARDMSGNGTTMDAKIHVEDASNTNGTTHVFNIETPAEVGGGGDQTKIQVGPSAPGQVDGDGEIYPDRQGKTMFDRYYLNS